MSGKTGPLEWQLWNINKIVIQQDIIGMEWNIEFKPKAKHWDPMGHSAPSWKNDRWKIKKDENLLI